MNHTKNFQWMQIRWILLGCIPLFFFLRGIHLILTGGGWIVSTDQPIHWVLLFLELFIAMFTVFGCFFLFNKESFFYNKNNPRNMTIVKIIITGILFTFIIHFIRVGFWIQNLVL